MHAVATKHLALSHPSCQTFLDIQIALPKGMLFYSLQHCWFSAACAPTSYWMCGCGRPVNGTLTTFHYFSGLCYVFIKLSCFWCMFFVCVCVCVWVELQWSVLWLKHNIESRCWTGLKVFKMQLVLGKAKWLFSQHEVSAACSQQMEVKLYRELCLL